MFRKNMIQCGVMICSKNCGKWCTRGRMWRVITYEVATSAVFLEGKWFALFLMLNLILLSLWWAQALG